jgi:hypothetical protein
MNCRPKVNLMWTVHNIVAHPLSEVVYLAACAAGALKLDTLSDCLEQASGYIHDVTIPNTKDRK